MSLRRLSLALVAVLAGWHWLAAVLALPVLAVRVRAWIWAAAVLWLTPMLFWFALPTLRAYFAVLRHRLGG